MGLEDPEQVDHQNRIMDNEREINLHSSRVKKSQDRKKEREEDYKKFRDAHDCFIGIPYNTCLVYWTLIAVILCAYGFDVLICRPTVEFFGLMSNLSPKEIQVSVWLIPAIMIGIEMGIDALVGFYGGALAKVGREISHHWLFTIWSWFLVFALSSIFVATQLASRNGLALHIFLLQVIPLAFFSCTTHLILIIGGQACRNAKSYPFFLIANVCYQNNVSGITRRAERYEERLHGMLVTYFQETYRYFSRYGVRIEASFTEQSIIFVNKFYGYTKISSESPKADGDPSHDGASLHGATGTDWDPLGDVRSEKK